MPHNNTKRAFESVSILIWIQIIEARQKKKKEENCCGFWQANTDCSHLACRIIKLPPTHTHTPSLRQIGIGQQSWLQQKALHYTAARCSLAWNQCRTADVSKKLQDSTHAQTDRQTHRHNKSQQFGPVAGRICSDIVQDISCVSWKVKVKWGNSLNNYSPTTTLKKIYNPIQAV